MFYGDYVLFDLETSGKSPQTAQIVQIAAVVINGRRLEIKNGTEFNTLVKPLYGEECATAGLEELSEGAIRVHGKTHEMLKDAPSLSSAMQNFKEYVDNYNFKKNSWSSPIPAGYNIIGYDLPIIERDLNRLKMSPFFHPIYKVDMLQTMHLFFENDKEVNSLSADNLIRNYMGYSKGQAHDAMSDVMMTAELLCRTMHFIRKTVKNAKFKGCFA